MASIGTRWPALVRALFVIMQFLSWSDG